MKKQKLVSLHLNKLFCLGLIFILTSCSSLEKKQPSEFSPQGFSATLYYTENGKSYKLKSEIYMLKPTAVRVDLRTQLDLPLASILLTEEKLEYLLYRDKKYFVGKPGPGALDGIVPLDVSAADLVSAMSERPLKDKKCFQVKGVVTRCLEVLGSTSGFNISWEKRNPDRPWLGRATKINIDLIKRGINLRFYLTDWQKNLSNLERFSSLQIPEDFNK
ncbi:MAG: hypothetical protein IPM57_05375 [Oligoflexia bacterium]|nr:hypothetical protein [Oligoflexia bacterium]